MLSCDLSASARSQGVSCETSAVSIPENVHVADTLTVRMSGTESLAIHAGDGSRACIAVWLEGAVDVAVQVTVGAEAVCECVVVCPSDAHNVRIRQEGHIAEGGTLHWRNVTLGSDVNQDIASHVEGVHGESSVDWMAYAKDQEHQDLRVHTMFEGREGAGEVVMKGVAEGRASIKAHGLIAIGPQGGGTNTYLTQNVLMLDASAKVDSVPSLEIKTNDVKASHSATVSRVTAEDLFYFASRGISAHEAKRMFVEGFLGDLTSRIADIALREHIAAMVGEKYARA